MVSPLRWKRLATFLFERFVTIIYRNIATCSARLTWQVWFMEVIVYSFLTSFLNTCFSIPSWSLIRSGFPLSSSLIDILPVRMEVWWGFLVNILLTYTSTPATAASTTMTLAALQRLMLAAQMSLAHCKTSEHRMGAIEALQQEVVISDVSRIWKYYCPSRRRLLKFCERWPVAL